MAKEYVVKFNEHLAIAKELSAKTTQKDELLPIIAEMEKAFPPYYEVGKKMAQSYIDEGPKGGNVMMGNFDEVAEKMGELTDKFLEVSHKGLIYKEEIIHASLTKTLESSQKIAFVSIITAIFSLLFVMGGGIYLYKSLESIISLLENSVGSVVKKIIGSTKQMNETSKQMTDVMSGVLSKAKTVSTSSSEMADNVGSVAASGEEMASTSTEITSQLEQSMLIVGNAVTEVENADATSQELDEASASIGELIKLIQGIAEQTNLLALNAAIESARAGEAGKGFAVVADEVKKLASQTSNATSDISDQIQRIQSVSKQVVTALGSIKEAIEGVEQNSTTISGAIQEQTIATNDISSSMTTAAQSTLRITEDINDVESSVNEAEKSVSQVLGASQVLSEEADKLSNEVERFLVEIR